MTGTLPTTTEIEWLNRAVKALKELGEVERTYLLDRFWTDAEISAELKRRIVMRAPAPAGERAGQ